MMLLFNLFGGSDPKTSFWMSGWVGRKDPLVGFGKKLFIFSVPVLSTAGGKSSASGWPCKVACFGYISSLLLGWSVFFWFPLTHGAGTLDWARAHYLSRGWMPRGRVSGLLK